MLIFLYILLGLALATVVVTLLMGAGAMSKRDEASRAKSNKWMWRRVWAQGIALCLLALVIMVKRTGG